MENSAQIHELVTFFRDLVSSKVVTKTIMAKQNIIKTGYYQGDDNVLIDGKVYKMGGTPQDPFEKVDGKPAPGLYIIFDGKAYLISAPMDKTYIKSNRLVVQTDLGVSMKGKAIFLDAEKAVQLEGTGIFIEGAVEIKNGNAELVGDLITFVTDISAAAAKGPSGLADIAKAGIAFGKKLVELKTPK